LRGGHPPLLSAALWSGMSQAGIRHETDGLTCVGLKSHAPSQSQPTCPVVAVGNGGSVGLLAPPLSVANARAKIGRRL
jgi:hypothetical protein